MSGYRVFPTCINLGYALISKIPEQTAEFTTELGIKCTTINGSDPNDKTELGSLSWPIRSSNVTIDTYVGYNGNLIEMNKSDVDAGNNYLTIEGNTTLTIELTGKEHSHAVIKVSIIPLQDTSSS